MRCHRLLLGSAWLGLVVAVVFASMLVTAVGANAQSASCPKPSMLSGPNQAQPQSDPPILKADDNATIVMHFSDSRARDTYFVPLTVYGRKLSRRDFAPDAGLAVVLTGSGYLRRDSSHRIALNDDGIKATLIPVGTQQIVVCVVVDPKDIGRLAPGKYTGAIAVVYGFDKTPLASVPVELTFRASLWTGAGIAFFAVFLGLAVKILAEASAEQRATGASARHALKAYTSQLSVLVMLILAVVAGALAFVQMYGGTPDWGSSSGDVVKLFTVCFLAQMSSNEAVDVARRVTGGTSGVHTGTANP